MHDSRAPACRLMAPNLSVSELSSCFASQSTAESMAGSKSKTGPSKGDQSFVRKIREWGDTMKLIVSCPFLQETKGSQSLGSPSPCLSPAQPPMSSVQGGASATGDRRFY